MKKKVELPVTELIYSTYHCDVAGCVASNENPSIRNWYLNEVMMLCCSKKFLSGFTTPEIGLERSSWFFNPYLDKSWFDMRFVDGHINYVVRKMLDEGFYVYYTGVDDYYVKGKTWYKQRHFIHDGIICGYDQEEKTYTILAYDTSWVLRKFKTSQQGFDQGRKAVLKIGGNGGVCGLKAKTEQVEFDLNTVRKNMIQYLDPSADKYPEFENEMVYGIAVQDHIVMYLDKLSDGSIPYERMDYRVFRHLWEHKRLMLERLRKAEDTLGIDHKTSDEYAPLVSEMNTMRMLYASHHLKRRDSVLPIIRKKMVALREKERALLEAFIDRTGETQES